MAKPYFEKSKMLIRVLDNSILRRIIILVMAMFMLYECHRNIVMDYKVYPWPSTFPIQFYELVSQISWVSIMISQLFASLGASFAYVYESNEVVLLFSIRSKRYRILARIILFDVFIIALISALVGFLSFLLAYPEMTFERPLTAALFTLIYLMVILLAFIPTYSIGLTLAILTRSLGISLVVSIFLSYVLFSKIHATFNAFRELLKIPRVYILKPILINLYPHILLLENINIGGAIALFCVSAFLLVFDLAWIERRDIL
ncbi:MAG TPA: hypothetical protein ENI59_02160 [Euryarchaeota archaeon]|nr:hypothetical protein [Euryarchaeota archaeon]